MTSKVQTVTGDVSPLDLGFTLTHEHMRMNFEHFYTQPSQTLAGHIPQSNYTLQNIGYVKQYPYSSKFNLKFDDKEAYDAVLHDLIAYKSFGGGTIVENSTTGLVRDVNLLHEFSVKSGVQVIAGTGHYINDLQSKDSLKLTVEEIVNNMTRELTEGCDENKSIKCGFMGEIASVWPLKDFERKAIKAAGEVQTQIGCGVSFHPHRVPEAPFEIIRLYLEAGGKAEKAVMSHLDRTLVEKEKLLQFSELGTYCQFDLFGVEVSYYQLNVATDMPSDAQRINMIESLLAEGKQERILMSHDIHTKHRLTSFGGHGYSHIMNNVLPKMKHKGISQEVIDQITINNPATWLAIKN